MDSRCPNCGSNATKSRVAAHELGTRQSQVKRSYSGLFFSRRLGVFLGGSRSRGSSQSLFAKRAGPADTTLLTVLLLSAIIALALSHYLIAASLGVIAVLAVLASQGADASYLSEWICTKCGSIFLPSAGNHDSSRPSPTPTPSPAPYPPRNSSTSAQTSRTPTRQCSICGQYRPQSEFSYGNRDDRSYCSTCSSEEKAAYKAGGADGARRFREERRAKWRKT